MLHSGLIFLHPGDRQTKLAVCISYTKYWVPSECPYLHPTLHGAPLHIHAVLAFTLLIIPVLRLVCAPQYEIPPFYLFFCTSVHTQRQQVQQVFAHCVTPLGFDHT